MTMVPTSPRRLQLHLLGGMLVTLWCVGCSSPVAEGAAV